MLRQLPMPHATILVIDDESLVRWSLKERLSSEGYDILEAGTAKEVLEQLAKGVDLLLLDFKLPDGDGLSILRRVKEQTPDTSSWQALDRAKGNQTQAAQLLGINRDQVRYRIEKFGLRH